MLEPHSCWNPIDAGVEGPPYGVRSRWRRSEDDLSTQLQGARVVGYAGHMAEGGGDGNIGIGRAKS